MSTKAQLEAENEELRAQLAKLQARAGGTTERPKPAAASFGLCAGVAADLEMHGQAMDPFTGKLVTADDVDTADDVEDLEYGPESAAEPTE